MQKQSINAPFGCSLAGELSATFIVTLWSRTSDLMDEMNKGQTGSGFISYADDFLLNMEELVNDVWKKR